MTWRLQAILVYKSQYKYINVSVQGGYIQHDINKQFIEHHVITRHKILCSYVVGVKTNTIICGGENLVPNTLMK